MDGRYYNFESTAEYSCVCLLWVVVSNCKSFNNNGERTYNANNANNGERTNNANNGERTKNAYNGERTALETSAQDVIVSPAHSNNHRQWSQIVSESLQK